MVAWQHYHHLLIVPSRAVSINQEALITPSDAFLLYGCWSLCRPVTAPQLALPWKTQHPRQRCAKRWPVILQWVGLAMRCSMNYSDRRSSNRGQARGITTDLAQSADAFVCTATARVPQLLPASVLRYELCPSQRLIELTLHRASQPGHASLCAPGLSQMALNFWAAEDAGSPLISLGVTSTVSCVSAWEANP